MRGSERDDRLNEYLATMADRQAELAAACTSPRLAGVFDAQQPRLDRAIQDEAMPRVPPVWVMRGGRT